MELTTLASDIADVILYFHHIQTYFHPNVCLEAKQSVMGVHVIKSGSKFQGRIQGGAWGAINAEVYRALSARSYSDTAHISLYEWEVMQ